MAEVLWSNFLTKEEGKLTSQAVKNISISHRHLHLPPAHSPIPQNTALESPGIPATTTGHTQNSRITDCFGLGRTIKPTQCNPQPWAGTSFAIPGCSKPHPSLGVKDVNGDYCTGQCLWVCI